MLLLKLMLVPALIGLLTLVGRRWGPAVAGWIGGFPIVAGPILYFVAVEQGDAFAAGAAAAAMSAVGANVGFILAYAWAALRWPWWACLLVGYAVFALAALALQGLALAPATMFWLLVIVIALATLGFPRGLDPRPRAQPSRAELLVRMAAAAALVLLVTGGARWMGPAVSGVLSAPPLIASVLAAFSLPVAGVGFTVRLLHAMVSGFYAIAVFCWCLTLWLVHWPRPLAFAAALGCGALANAAAVLVRRRLAARSA